MKAGRGGSERALQAPGIRLFLLHGPDIAGSDALLARFVSDLGKDVERVTLTAGLLKTDPALLADEAASFSLFGGSRYIHVEGGGDELLGAVENLFRTPTAGNPVLITAGPLRKGSKLLAFVENAPGAMAIASYVPEGRDADRMVADLGRALGLSILPDLARRVAEASEGDRALVALELDKFALFLDADPERPAMLHAAVVDALSAGSEEGDLARIVDAVLDGDSPVLEREMAQLSGTEGVPLVRALSRRVLLLARMRAEIERGNSVDAVMASAGKSLFFKDEPAVARQLGHWSATRLATVLSRLLAAERDLKSPGSLGPDAIGEPLFVIAQAAARRR